MSSFVLDKFNGGKSDFEDRGVQGAFKSGTNLDIRKEVDSLSCQQGLVSETGVTFSGLLIAVIPSNDGNSYGFSKDGKIYKRISAGTWSLVYTDSEAITGAEEWYGNNGKTFLYWATPTKIHRKEIPGVAGWTDVDAAGAGGDPWPKTNLDSATYHTMKQAGGALMICNNNKLAMVGYDQSYTNEAVNLIPGNISKALSERDGQSIIGTYRQDNSEQGALFSWEQTALSWINKRLIPAKGINAIIDTEITLMQAGTNGGVFYSDLINVLPAVSFPGGGQVNPNGVENDNGMALFGVFGNGTGNSGIWSYGRKKKNAPFVPNLEYQFDCDEIGAVRKIGTDLIFSYKSGSTYGVKRVDTSNKANAIYQSIDLKVPGELMDQSHNWTSVKLLGKDMPTGCAVEVWYRADKKGSFIQATMEGGTLQFTSGQAAIFYTGEEAVIFEAMIKLFPNGNNTPEIYRAEVFLD